MTGKKIKVSNRVQRELEKQNVRFLQKNNNFFVTPPDSTLPAYTWHKNDQHVAAFVDFVRKNWSSCIDLDLLGKVHKSFRA